MDDVVLHAHRKEIAQVALECPCVCVPPLLLARVVWRPDQLVLNVGSGDLFW